MPTRSFAAEPMVPALSGACAALAPAAEAPPRIAAGLLLVLHGAQNPFGWFGGGRYSRDALIGREI